MTNHFSISGVQKDGIHPVSCSSAYLSLQRPGKLRASEVTWLLRARSLSFKMTRRYLLLGVSKILWSSAHAKCYNPDGTDRNAGLPQEYYQPCDSGDEFSMCCRLGAEFEPDKCRSDGLCFGTSNHKVWRESCTDPSWRSSSCFKLCHSETGIPISCSAFKNVVKLITC